MPILLFLPVFYSFIINSFISFSAGFEEGGVGYTTGVGGAKHLLIYATGVDPSVNLYVNFIIFIHIAVSRVLSLIFVYLLLFIN